MKIVQNYVKSNPCYWSEGEFSGGKPKGLMLHSVGCAQSDAKVFNRTFNGDVGACVHAFIDANDGTVYQHLPWTHKAWHCAGTGNQTHIGVEMCESTYITYTQGATFTVSNLVKAQNNCKVAYLSAVELFAYLCKMFNLNPLTQICSHNEGNRLGIASAHGDPEHYWRQLKMSYTMDGFRKDVKAKMGGTATTTTTTTTTTANKAGTIYRVQCGAFSVKTNAEALCATLKKKGYNDAFVVKASSGISDILYRVQCGAFSIKSNADALKAKLVAAGYKDAFIVTSANTTTAKKTVAELAREVIDGKWGVGEDRKNRLTAAGYNYTEVQNEVNRMLG